MALQIFPDISKKTTLSDGTSYAYIRIPAADPTKPTFLLFHGFPSSSYDWRHVIPLLQKSGHGIIAPDLLGYGDTDKPTEFSDYSFRRMGNHAAEIVRIEGLSKVIGVGHDWGSGALSAAVITNPQLFSGLIFLAVGYIIPGGIDIDTLNARMQEAFGYPTYGYWKFFNEDTAASVLDANPASLTSLLYPTLPEDWKTTMGPFGAAKEWVSNGKVAPLPTWMTEEEAETRNKIFQKGGYTGPLNWYRSAIRGVDAAWAASDLATDESKSLDIPAMVVAAQHDYVCRPEVQALAAEKFLRKFRLEKFESGHWIPLEKPDELVKLMEDFTGGL